MNAIPFDELAFGNPNQTDQMMMRKENYLDRELPKLYTFTPPPNSSLVTRTEIEKLIQYVNSKRVVKNNLYDEALLQTIKQHFIDNGASEEFVTTVTNEIAEDVIPLVTKLKYHFNRPRPIQLSYYYDVNFFPDFSFFVNNPSYPSGHTTLTAITCHVLGNLFPENFDKINAVIKEARDSRLYLGVHYPSDNDMAMKVAKTVLENAEFKMKYRL